MPPHLDDYDTTETVDIVFNSFTSDDPSASCTITDLVAGDIEIHKDGGLTQRASDNGVTVSIDFDGVTGGHKVSIDLSDNSDAGFYANGSRYQVRMEGTTIDGATVNAWIATFSIGCMLRPTTAGRKLDVESGGCAGIDWANVANPTTAVDLSGTDIQLCDTVSALTGHTAQSGDTYAALPANFSDLSITATTGRVDVASIEGSDATDQINVACDTAIETYHLDHLLAADYDPASPPGAATALLNELVESDAGVSRFTANALEQAPDTTTGLSLGADQSGVTVGTVNTLTGHTAQTGDTYAALPTNFSSMGIEVDGHVHGDLKEWLGTAPLALASQRPQVEVDAYDASLDFSATQKASINSEVDDVLATDTVTLPGQAAPPNTPTIEQMIGYLYKAWRNKIEGDSSTVELYDNAGTTVDQKWSVSDDTTDFTKGAVESGP